MTSTFIIAVLLSTVQFFVRNTTLDSVRTIEFELIYRLIDPQISNLQDEKITYALDAISYKQKSTLFPIALMNQDKCIENSFHDKNKSLCSKYRNSIAIDLAIKSSKLNQYYGITFIRVNEKESLLYKQFHNSKYILVGDAGKYLAHSELEKFIIFLKTDWIHYYTNLHGLENVWKKSHFIFIITFGVSTVLWFIFISISSKNRVKYEILRKKSEDLNLEWEKLNDDFNSLIQEQTSLDEQIHEHKVEIEIDPNKKKLAEEIISKLTNAREQIELDLHNKRKELLDLENQENNLNQKIEYSYSKLSSVDQQNELSFLVERLNRIKLLWRRGPTWKERHEIEAELSENKDFIPFTISQSFIAFEKSVIRMAAKRFESYTDRLSLNDCIELIDNSININKEDVALMHNVRIARNRWFHNGRRPSAKDIENIIEFLNKYNIDPELL
jgi:hypothetical protein